MKRHSNVWPCIALLGAAVCVAAGFGPLPALAEQGKTIGKGAGVIEKFRLPNGLTVVIRENHSSPVVAVQAWVKAGSRTEPSARSGMSHILEHMAFKGTKRRGPGEIAREVEGLGGEINAYTSFDHTVYHITISGRFLENALDILSDTLGNSIFDAGELAREKEVVLEELRMNEDNPGRVNSKALFREAYRVHPYGRPVIGYADTIRKTSRKDLLSYFARFYSPANMVLVIAGDVDPAKARPMIERTFGALKGHSDPGGKIPAEPPQKELRVTVQERDAKRVYLDMGFHGPSMRSREVFAWDLLSSILGGGQTSRLYREVKDSRGLVDSISAYSYTPRDPGVLLVGATASPDKAIEALRETLVQTFRMGVRPPEGEELARAKTSTESDFLYSLESQGSLARHVGFFETTLGDGGYETKYLQRIRSVTAEEIRSAARKHLKPGNLTISLVVPPGEAATFSGDAVTALVKEAYREATREEPQAEARTGLSTAREVLENGIRVVVREDRSVPVVAVQAGFLAGVRAEPADKGGLSTITAELLTKGTRERGAREIAEAVENIAADLSGFSGRNSLGLRAKFMRKDLEQGFRLFAESLRGPTFPEEELEKKRTEILGRLSLQKDDMTRSVFLLFLARHYGEHPYARNPLGSEESVRGIARKDVADYYERISDPRNLVIAVSGDIGTDEALSIVRKAFGDLPRNEGFVPPGAMPVAEEKGIRRIEERRDKEQAHFVIGYTGARFTDPDRYALDLLGASLAGQGGRLFTNLRDRKSLAYSVTSFSSEQVDPGFFAFYMGTSADKLEGAISDTLQEIEEVARNGVTEEEFERAKRWTVGNYEIGLQSNLSYADRMMYNELYGVGYEETFRAPEKIEAVTLSEVNREARKVLSEGQYTIAILRGR